jgi:formylglycine-generating enzyme required for sulfatase activity
VKIYFRMIVSLTMICLASEGLAQVSSGTAFAVAPGLLITNHHVIEGCGSVDIISPDGRRSGATVDADAQIDLALLRVTGIKGATARLRSPRQVRLGESVMVFGFPLAGSLTSGGNFTSGLVSGLRGLRDAAGEIQITAPVQPGNSGGPVMDASGLVIGVVQAKLDALRSAIATGDIPQNVNFAISLEVLADFLAKNRVAFRDATVAAALDTARVAELAQSFTYRVECRGKSQQAASPPGVKSSPLPTGSAKQTFKDCGDCPEMVVIPAGSFLMGSKADPFASFPPDPTEMPQHLVSVKAFSLGKFEVTQEQWFALMGNLPSRFKGRTLPVDQVSWDDAQAFVKKLSEKTGQQYRLPSEAEWEYACRAGGQAEYCGGDRVDDVGWYSTNSILSTRPVGGKQANAWGLHDMSGNVWEWTQDCWNDNYSGAPADGSAWITGSCSLRVVRGGSMFNISQNLRAAYRFRNAFAVQRVDLGLRVARTD